MSPSRRNPNPFGSKPITEMMRGSQEGDSQSQSDLWNAVSEILISYSRKRLQGKANLDGPEGIANEAFFQLLKGLEENRFRNMNNRQDLLQVMLNLCERRIIDSERRAHAKKRGAGQKLVRGDLPDADGNAPIWEQVSDDAIKGIIVAETFQELLELVANEFPEGPDYEIFRYAYIVGYDDDNIASLLNKKYQSGLTFTKDKIGNRRKKLLEYLRDEMGDRE